MNFKMWLVIIVIGAAVLIYQKLGYNFKNSLSSGQDSDSLLVGIYQSIYQSHQVERKQLLNIHNTTESDGQIHKERTEQNTSKNSFLMPQTPPPNLPWNKKDLNINPTSLMNQPWVRQLWEFLQTKIDKQFPIVITSSSFSYQSSLLNWLAQALVRTEEKDSLKNILILSLDKKLHSFLSAKNFSSLYLPPFFGSRNEGILCIEIARLITMRLINFWGYNVINYDSDAYILKNPQSLFELYPESHVIGSESYMPHDLHDKWGVTLCMGVVYIKASPETGE